MTGSIRRLDERRAKTKRRNMAVFVSVFVALAVAYAFIANNALVLDSQNTRHAAQLNATEDGAREFWAFAIVIIKSPA